MTGTLTRAFLAAAMLTLAPLTVAHAASINYGDMSGDSVAFVDIEEATVTDAPPLYGTPTPAADTLVFDPTFASASADGAADTTSGTLTLQVIAEPGKTIESIAIIEWFDADLLGVDPAGTTAAMISGLLVVQDLTAGHSLDIYQSVLDVLGILGTPPWIFDLTPFDGSLIARAELDLAGLGITHVGLTFNNNLQTISIEGTSAAIAKSGIELHIITPEPASLCLLGLGVMCLSLRRR